VNDLAVIILQVALLMVASAFLGLEIVMFIRYGRQRKAAGRALVQLAPVYDPAREVRKLHAAGFNGDQAAAIMGCVARMNGIDEGH
jgi:hypothetical protein